ncbi:MAG: MarR family transcriptional regulator [Phycisphaerales bacterium]|nr:MAG: MarR family transcriptional regulator [Phycisphaerales bacterium]
MPIEEEPGSRRQQIVALLLRQGPMTIADLADALGVAKTSLRPQLDRLVLQGWLDRDRRRKGPGRPADVFSASDRSRQDSAQQTMGELAWFLLEEVADTETRSKVTSVLDGVGRRVTSRLRPIIGDGPPSERLRRLSEYLSQRGILNDTKESRQAITLSIHTCPYVGLADGHQQICAMHRRTLADLLGAKTAEHRCRHEGQRCCEFAVNVGSSKPASGAERKRKRPAGAKKKTKRRK